MRIGVSLPVREMQGDVGAIKVFSQFTAIATRSRKVVSKRCWRGLAGFPTRRTGSILKQKKRLSPTPSNTRPMARSASVTNCASVACSCRPAACAASGFATTWLTSRRG